MHGNKKTSGKIALKLNHLFSSTENVSVHCPENPFMKEQQNYADNTKMISFQVKQQYIGKKHARKITVSSFTNKENKSGCNIYRKQAIRPKCRLVVNPDIDSFYQIFILGTNIQDRRITNRVNLV